MCSISVVLHLPPTPRVRKKLFCRRIRFPEERDGYKDGDTTVHITSCRNIEPNLFLLLLCPTELQISNPPNPIYTFTKLIDLVWVLGFCGGFVG